MKNAYHINSHASGHQKVRAENFNGEINFVKPGYLFQAQAKGFTLTEVLIAMVIIGILSSISLPSFLNQVNRTRQNDAAATISQIQTTIAAYADEFGVLPTSWTQLNDTSAVMTDDGPATQDNFQAITLAGGYYNVEIDPAGNLFTITATRDDEPNLNIVACVNLTNGASAINQGTKAAAASSPNCG